MMTVKVKAIGHGLGYNKYEVNFEFTMNGKKSDWEDSDQFWDDVNGRVVREAKRKTSCDSVTIKDVDVVEK